MSHLPGAQAMPYDAAFFRGQMGGSLRSALAVLPILLARWSIGSAIDVGCGVGPWAAACLRLGLHDVRGVDGSYVDVANLMIPPECFDALDLNGVDRHTELGRFDLAICVEVAEHLPSDRARPFVGFLTGLADMILFGAAIPDQGGTRHVNEQWPSYWAEIFGVHGYRPFDIVRPVIWSNPGVEYWYRQNTILYVSDRMPVDGTAASAVPSLDVVHPELYIRKSRMLSDALRNARPRGG